MYNGRHVTIQTDAFEMYHRVLKISWSLDGEGSIEKDGKGKQRNNATIMN